MLSGWEPQAHLSVGGTLEVGRKILGPFTNVGEHGECGPSYEHRGALRWRAGGQRGLTYPWAPQDAALSALSPGSVSPDDNCVH